MSREQIDNSDDIEVLKIVLEALGRLPADSRRKILDTAQTFLGIRPSSPPVDLASNIIPPPVFSTQKFSDHAAMEPKQFLLDKSPKTDVERVACLAFYLTHYRDQGHFKTADISSLNVEAAQPKFSNTAYAVENAVRRGLLVPSLKGQKQLSAHGDRFVQALPDRDGAAASLKEIRIRKKSAKKRSVIAKKDAQ